MRSTLSLRSLTARLQDGTPKRSPKFLRCPKRSPTSRSPMPVQCVGIISLQYDREDLDRNTYKKYHRQVSPMVDYTVTRWAAGVFAYRRPRHASPGAMHAIVCPSPRLQRFSLGGMPLLSNRVQFTPGLAIDRAGASSFRSQPQRSDSTHLSRPPAVQSMHGVLEHPAKH
jgi:hypothetical protein